MQKTALQMEIIRYEVKLHMAFDLSHKTWKIAFGVPGKAARIITMPARDLPRLQKEIDKALKKFGLRKDTRIVSCYEAGRDGFWLHRYLTSFGITNLIIDPSSIETSGRKRRVKTDKVDAQKLLKKLISHFRDDGEKEDWSVVRVPSVEDEDNYRPDREYDRLLTERTGHSNRMNSLLVKEGIVLFVTQKFETDLKHARRYDGSEIGPKLKTELLREYKRWCLVTEQIKELEKHQRSEYRASLKAQADRDESNAAKPNQLDKVVLLMALHGVGEKTAWPLVFQFFWRKFKNRREVGGAAGLTGTPHDSGESTQEQGISKAGNKRIRKLMVELSWLWVRYQPRSRITRWWQERFADNGKRMRRVGIVGVARRLLIALWQYVEFGVMPEGARLTEQNN